LRHFWRFQRGLGGNSVCYRAYSGINCRDHDANQYQARLGSHKLATIVIDRDPSGMASVATRSFDDPDLYFSAIRAMKGSGFVLPKRGVFGAELARVEFDSLWLQSGRETIAGSGHISVDVDRRPIGFLTHDGSLPIVVSGGELPTDNLIFYSPGATHYQCHSGGVYWSAMSLSPQDLDDASRRITDQTISIPSSTQHIKPPTAEFSRLKSLHREAILLGQSSIEVLTNSVSARHLEHNLTLAMIACLTAGEEKRFHRAWYRHKHIMDRFEQWIEAHPDQPAHLLEVCADLDISARSLTLCCRDHLGMSPMRYLWLRRMNLARRELQEAQAPETVTTIALSFGFSHLGRFSVEYRTLFGELPSQTLAHRERICEGRSTRLKMFEFARTG
jgi:AraC-like DNA-binding protein